MVKVYRRAGFAALIIMLTGLQTFPSGAIAATGQQAIESAQLVNDSSEKLPAAGIRPKQTELEDQIEAKSSCESVALSPVPRKDVVDAAFCQLLHRLPEESGQSYWGSELDDGLALVRLLAAIQGGDEYKRSESYSLVATLDKVTISQERSETPRQAELLKNAAADQDQRVRVAELAAAKQAEVDAARRAAAQEVERREATLLKRQVMSTGQFNTFVGSRQFSSTEYLTPSLVHGTYRSGNQKVNVLLVHLSGSRGFSVSPGNRAQSTVGSWATEIGAQAAINGNWFNPYDGPAVSSGKVYGGKDHGYTSLFGITLQKDLIMEHHSRVNNNVDSRIVFGVSGHPTLVFQGQKTTDFGNDPTFTARHPRTAIGANRQGDVLVFVTIDGRSSGASGMTGIETANLMAKLGSANAVMLDGGGSTTMWIAGRGVVNTPSTGVARPVANQIAVFGS